MIVAADDLLDWVADREALLIAAWTPAIERATGWERPFAEVLASELQNAMVTTWLNGGSERDFLRLVAQSNTGLLTHVEKAIAGRFYDVTLKLARAAVRHVRDHRSTIMAYKYGMVVGDGRTNPSHLTLQQVLLPKTHPFWLRFQPPFGMDCRCGTNLMTQSQFARSGRTITSDTDLAWIEAQLHDDWPSDFLPLLDFRKPLPIAIDAEPKVHLTAEQLAGILAAFR